jgi:hypothetical protein
MLRNHRVRDCGGQAEGSVQDPDDEAKISLNLVYRYKKNSSEPFLLKIWTILLTN